MVRRIFAVLYDENDEAMDLLSAQHQFQSPPMLSILSKMFKAHIVEIVDENCAEVVGYTYDAWGT
jgi:hypothetical protein